MPVLHHKREQREGEGEDRQQRWWGRPLGMPQPSRDRVAGKRWWWLQDS